MKNHPLKLTTLAVAMLSSFHASAALYRVVEVTPPSDLTYGESGDNDTYYESAFGISIAPETGSVSCFTSSCGDDAYLLSGETRYQGTMAGQPIDGINFKEEVPFGFDYGFNYIDSESEFQSFCSAYYGYSTCNYWASDHWDEYQREADGKVTSYAFTELSAAPGTSELAFSSAASDGNNNVITSTDESDNAVGFALTTGDSRATITPSTANNTTTYQRARQWVLKDSIAAGSVSTSGSPYNSYAALWLDNDSPFVIGWNTGSGSTTESSSRYSQGSIRDFIVTTNTDDDGNALIYAVGLNSYTSNSINNRTSATLFKISYTDLANDSTWGTTTKSAATISGTLANSSDGNPYIGSKLTAINDNLIAVGEAKLSSAGDGAYSNKLFVTNVSNASPSADYISDDAISGTTISSAGGHVNAINDNNVIVGQIDTESAREKDGKPRRKRGFIYPYSDSSTSTTIQNYLSSIFNSKAWVLDDLTNGDTNGDSSYSSANNAYRILSANDINDAGVIAATAIKCSGGYDSTANNATCGGGSTDEITVAVKLIPINGADSDDIHSRGYEATTTVERQGASFGLFGLAGLFGLLMYRRKK